MTTQGSDIRLVIGADGGLGNALARRLVASRIPVIGTSRRHDSQSLKLDLTSDPSSWELPPQIGVAYLCAAITSIDRCQKQPVETRLVNVEHTLILANRLHQLGAHLVFLSTNQVFDGSQPHRQAEDDVCPFTEYGRQKAEVEREVLAMGGAVVRLTKVFAQPPALFRTWADDLWAGKPIAPYQDMLISPVSVSCIGDVLVEVGTRRRSGILQVSGEADISYADIAWRIAMRLGVRAELVQPRSAIEIGLSPEMAPRYTTLDTTRLRHEFGIIPPPCMSTIRTLIDDAALPRTTPTTWR